MNKIIQHRTTDQLYYTLIINNNNTEDIVFVSQSMNSMSMGYTNRTLAYNNNLIKLIKRAEPCNNIL